MIHRAIDMYMKDIYKSFKLTDGLGRKTVWEMREHKHALWWEMVKDGQGKERKENGQMRTMEGRRIKEHEDLALQVIGRNWRDKLQEAKTSEEWICKTKEKVALYLEKHKLPQDPRYQNWQEKKKER